MQWAIRSHCIPQGNAGGRRPFLSRRQRPLGIAPFSDRPLVPKPTYPTPLAVVYGAWRMANARGPPPHCLRVYGLCHMTHRQVPIAHGQSPMPHPQSPIPHLPCCPLPPPPSPRRQFPHPPSPIAKTHRSFVEKRNTLAHMYSQASNLDSRSKGLSYADLGLTSRVWPI